MTAAKAKLVGPTIPGVVGLGNVVDRHVRALKCSITERPVAEVVELRQNFADDDRIARPVEKTGDGDRCQMAVPPEGAAALLFLV